MAQPGYRYNIWRYKDLWRQVANKISNKKTLITAWCALTEKDGQEFLETRYFYNDGTFIIINTPRCISKA